MKILYISADFGVPVLGFKGASVHVRELTDALVNAGHEVVIMTPNIGAGNTARSRVIHVSAPRLPSPASTVLRSLDTPWWRGQCLEREVRELRYNTVLLQHVQRFAAQWHPDLLYERYALFGLAGGTLAHRLRLPYLLEVNAPLRLERRRGPGVALERPARWCERRIFGRAGYALCVSRAMADYVLDQGIRPARVRIQPNAVDPTRFQPDDRGGALRAQLGFGDDHVVIGFLGSLKTWHGVEQLVAAFARARTGVLAPRLRLMIVGDGPARPAIERLIAEFAVDQEVVLVGNVPHVDVPRYLAAMDIAAAPYGNVSPDFYFSPLKLFEYMAAGRAVIAPQLGQISELLDNGENGILYTPGETAELANGLVTLAERADLRTSLGRRAAETARARFTWEATARRVVALAGELASEQSAVARRAAPWKGRIPVWHSVNSFAVLKAEKARDRDKSQGM
jgi:glycosyltransferase involved in cell wall biosynthesis